MVGAKLNYHPLENPPLEPEFFWKPTSTLIANGQDIVIPSLWNQINWEVELGVVMKRGRYIKEKEALDFVDGYICALDMTFAQGPNVFFSKSLDKSTPISSMIQIPKSIIESGEVNLSLHVNGKEKVNHKTKDIIHSLEKCISHASKYFTWEDGDILLTGAKMNGPCYGGDKIKAILQFDNTTEILTASVVQESG